MKKFLLFVLVLLIWSHLTEAQQSPTFADPPGPEHVLVVYNTRSNTSRMVKDYYVDARQIPNSNIVELDSLDTLVTVTYNDISHTIYLDQQGEIIRDSINQNSLTPTIHAWLYFNERVA